MQQDLMRYDLMVQEALKGVVRKVLTDAAKDGLLGDHHFYISFRTDYPGVRVSSRLREKYAEEMTIVLQHQFWDLAVSDHNFEVGLSFSGVPERLLVPFDALTGFFDPAVQFGLKFEVRAPVQEAPDEPVPAVKLPKAAKASVQKSPKAKAAPKEEAKEPAPAETGAQVVSLDAFRKKT